MRLEKNRKIKFRFGETHVSTDLGAGAPICTEHRKLDLGNSLVIGVGSCDDSPWRAYAGRAINGRRITGAARSTAEWTPKITICKIMK